MVGHQLPPFSMGSLRCGGVTAGRSRVARSLAADCFRCQRPRSPTSRAAQAGAPPLCSGVDSRAWAAFLGRTHAAFMSIHLPHWSLRSNTSDRHGGTSRPSAIGRHEQVPSCLPSRLVSRASAPEVGELLGKGSALVVTSSSGGRTCRQIHHVDTERVERLAVRKVVSTLLPRARSSSTCAASCMPHSCGCRDLPPNGDSTSTRSYPAARSAFSLRR